MTFLKIKTMLRHLWLDASDAKRAIGPDALQRLTQRVAASEHRHTGQLRICVEAALPMSYLRRLSSQTTLAAVIRQRATMLFSKLRVWDTEHHNGVLIYLQLAERAIEIVADRGLSRQVPQHEWQAMTGRMSAAFSAGRFEDGLTQALEEVSALLVAHFPVVAQSPGAARPGDPDNLPDEPVLQ